MIGKFYQQIIVRYGDLRATLRGPLAENGYMVINDYFGQEDLVKFPAVSASLKNGEESYAILNAFPFLNKLLFDPSIISIVKDYLGPKAVLDFASCKRFLASGPKSDTWHHDSVGHRIKIFLCLTDQDESTHTEIVPATHLINYSDYRNSRLNASEIESKYEILKIIGKKNDLIIFDTNLKHKGVYSDIPRDLVQFEFSDIRKSMLKGHVGIRKSIFDKSIAGSPLISKKHLHIKETFAYFK